MNSLEKSLYIKLILSDVLSENLYRYTFVCALIKLSKNDYNIKKPGVIWKEDS